ncbi:MAG: HIT family protein [Chloroflexi bacterium]|nr:HIT family protein [Chloroflexota bacterium]
MTSCIFCEIIAGRADSTRVLEDETCLAFMDIRPINAGHVLVVPKTHAKDLSDLPAENGGRMFQMAQMIANALMKSEVRCEGVNLMLAHGKAAGQEVFHAHLHVIPRYRGDNLKIRFNLLKLRPTRAELDRIAAQIRHGL